MIYVPLLKSRQEELRVANALSYCFSDTIIPLFEVIKDQYKIRYQKDPITNDFIYKQHGKIRRRVAEPFIDSDIITLENISKLIGNNNKAFIDYFRFTIERYGSNINLNNSELAWKISHDFQMYKNRLEGISSFDNLIPVISIKKGFYIKSDDLLKLLQQLQALNSAVALRITEEWLSEYKYILQNILRSDDYLLFDINEQLPASKFIELEELADMNISAKVVLLNSPRKSNVKNGEYEQNGTTLMIDNSAREKFKEYGFDGFGDYGGLKDNMPTNDGSNGMGAALALIYNYDDNAFYSFLNPDTKMGMSGYYKIIPEILNHKSYLDPDNNCPAMYKIEHMNSCGNWSSWHNITLTRYLHQMYLNL